MIKLKDILTEAKSPTVLNASMLNISKKDLQPFVKTINATMGAIAKQYKQKFPKDGNTTIRQGSPYVELIHTRESFGDRVSVDSYELAQGGSGNSQSFRNRKSQGNFFTGRTADIAHYVDSNESTPDGERIANGTYGLTRQFNNKGQFNKSIYDSWMTKVPRNMKLNIKRGLFGSIPKGGTEMLQAFQMMSKYIARHRVMSISSLSGTQADDEIYNIIFKKYPPVVAAISSQIDQLVDNKIAQFAAAITSQVGA